MFGYVVMVVAAVKWGVYSDQNFFYAILIMVDIFSLSGCNNLTIIKCSFELVKNLFCD